MRISRVLAAAFLLAACAKGGGQGANESAGVDAAANVVANAPAPIEPRPVVAHALPSPFIGRWGMGPNDCDPKQADVAKGLMVVAETKLTFYEARATVRTITLAKPDHAIVDLDWSGEGQTWTTHTPLTLASDGKALTRLDHETGKEIRYARCPEIAG